MHNGIKHTTHRFADAWAPLLEERYVHEYSKLDVPVEKPATHFPSPIFALPTTWHPDIRTMKKHYGTHHNHKRQWSGEVEVRTNLRLPLPR
jgi:hypothetical protein